ncbi:hypothetical protein PAMA_004229 [Pampus argenteus]
MASTLFDISIKPGDLIEFYRGTFEHWAVYIGGNEVVHLVPQGAEDDSVPFSNLMSVLDSGIAEVMRHKIWEVADSDRYRVNNLQDDEYEPRDRSIIVRDACSMVGQRLPYCLVSHNCEHFVTELRYGKPESRQVKTVAVIAGVTTAVVLGATLFSFLLKDNNKRRNHK